MSPRLLFLFAFLILSSISASAQKAICGFDGINQRLKQNAEYLSGITLTESKIRQKVAEIAANRQAMRNMNVLAGALYEIPVVVHVIYKTGDGIPGSSSNPTDAQIQAAIDRLNANFAAAANSGNIGASIPIRFALAKRRPDCGSTSGIERINGGSISGYDANGVSAPGSGASGANETAVKNLSTWSEKSYYNIWVVWKISSNVTGSGFVAGYASLPYIGDDYHIFPAEGMVILGQQMSPGAPTLTHEMGHAFGLYHTFEGGNEVSCPVNGSCSEDGDKVCDTDPVKNLLSIPCPAATDINPCTNTPYGTAQNNIMGYGACLNRFTQGQSDRMMATLLTARGGLINSLATVPPPPTPVKAAIQIPPNIRNINNTNNIGPCTITLGNMSYASYGYNQDGYNYYSDNSCNIGTNLFVASNQYLSVTTQTNTQVCKAWIDANNDGQFSNDELVLNSTATSPNYTHTTVIPVDLLYGAAKNTLLRMRVMADVAFNNDFTAGSQLFYGQTEDFWVNIDQALPVVFERIDARIRNQLLEVEWNTSTETNNDHFIIEASADGTNFLPLARVASKARNGSSDHSLQYHISVEGNGQLALAFGLIALLLSVQPGHNRRKWLFVVSAVLLCLFITCNKHEITDTEAGDQPRFIRIAQVDKNGVKQYSKTVRIVAE
ncbi:GEVED domain-containing protein [Niabella sp. CC-SYL272]|uniref:M43 family zinc metalloprotease n=1 Tax=Niabella agricola TaxID=2891571 RepID=UPI001EED4F5E|nr:M43 family zinc metalloprotease [Niabella agricola]MCF3109076.1 GEVED domain-containing protein [Niabella agricola]